MIESNNIAGMNAENNAVCVPRCVAPLSEPRVIHLRSVQELREAASLWNDLWLRSEVTFPTMRAEHLAQWIEHFAANSEFHAIIVEQAGRFLAALPMLRRKIGHILKAGILPCNEWSSSGEFLLDQAADVNRMMEVFLDALEQCGWPLVWLDEVILEAPRWRTFIQSAADRHLKCFVRSRWQVGRIRIHGDWETYRASWSRKHRQHTAGLARRLSREGKIELVLRSNLEPNAAVEQMQLALDIEDSGWKGRAGSSVLSVPGMSEYFIRQAGELAARGQLELAFLQCGGKPIAFCYGQSAKGVFHSAKIGYDPRYSEFSPGQLLRFFLLEQFFSEPGRVAMDFLGPITESHSHWRPDKYTVARYSLALRPLASWHCGPMSECKYIVISYQRPAISLKQQISYNTSPPTPDPRPPTPDPRPLTPNPYQIHLPSYPSSSSSDLTSGSSTEIVVPLPGAEVISAVPPSKFVRS